LYNGDNSECTVKRSSMIVGKKPSFSVDVSEWDNGKGRGGEGREE